MSKEGALKVLDPPIKALMDRMPTAEKLAEIQETGEQAIAEMKHMSLTTRQVVKRWWRALPNNGVRAGIAAGIGLLLGMIPVLSILYWRRRALTLPKEVSTRP